jgi:BirA family transcriptional regulator, biotin operon repressor / biotin---[acetyl-CoA-carboxylase] ligase
VDPRISLSLRQRLGRPVTGESLAAELRLPHRRITAEIDQLAAAGFIIESHPMLGHRLVGVPDSLIAEEIAFDLRAARAGRRVRCVEEAASTNDLAWQAAVAGQADADGMAIFAEHQSAGRGRRGNRWLAPAHTSVLCSILIWVPQAASQAGGLTRAAAVAVAEAIEEECHLAAGIKWPNDLVVEDKKVAGILVESRPEAGGTGPAVIGVGINCSQAAADFPTEFRSQVASLAMFADSVDRTLLARALLRRLDRVLTDLDSPDGAESVRTRAAARCRTLGRKIVVSDGQTTYSGEVLDLDPDYGLVLRLQEGGIRRFPAMTTHVAGPSFDEPS